MKMRVLLITIFLFCLITSPVMAQADQPMPLPSPFKLSAEVIAGFAGILISLFFSYFPILKTKFAGLTSEAKSGIMIGLMALVTVAITAFNYFGILDAGITFTKGWEWHVLWIFALSVMGNQTAHRISPETKAVTRAKKLRVTSQYYQGQVR